jgi:hypothetical protein
LGIKASAPPAKIPTPTLGLKAAASSEAKSSNHKKTLIGIAPVIPPPPAVPDVDFPDVPPPPPPSLEAAAPAAPEPAPAAALVTEESVRDVAPAPVAAKTPAPEVDRESAPPPVDAIAPVTFSEHPPGVVPKEEPASAVAKPKEADPMPSGPAHSETPLSTGPETFDPVTSLEPARRSPNWALIGAAAAVVLLVAYWIQRGPAGPKTAASSAPLEATPAVAEPPKVEAPKVAGPAAVPDSKPAEASNAAPAPEPSAAASAPSVPASAGAAIPVPSASANAAAPEASASASPSAGGEGTKTISIVTRPPGARIFHHGKEVGTTPLTIDLPEGEKRKFEVGLPGHVTRKLIVDGTKTEIVLGMRPAK